ncbi:MAG TPA: thiamine-phosphate kinase [Candidatus Binatia bacterium]|nr:thiamine-phosphate kinase [Candidatus Binatia bacterium]
MKLTRLGEFGLIQRIQRAIPVGRGVRIGIGDDAAWVKNPTGSSLVTADLLIEGVHFDLKWTSLFELGYKSLAVNLSDIAAMGGVAAYAMVSVGLPINLDSNGVDEFYRGVKALAAPHRVAIIGGDTNMADLLIVSVCVIGHAPYRPVRRSGAGVGDDIYVTGTLGDSALGLKLLREPKSQLKRKGVAQLIGRHHRPTPRLTAGALLAKYRLATAMIDVSDGLMQDLTHICRASGTGAVVWQDHLPLSPAYRALAGKDGTRLALSGGEDYELLFCAHRKNRTRVKELLSRAGVAITWIGTCVTANRGVVVVDDCERPVEIPLTGHDHFKKV